MGASQTDACCYRGKQRGFMPITIYGNNAQCQQPREASPRFTFPSHVRFTLAHD